MPKGPELWIVIGVIVLLFGGSQLPKFARNLGQAQEGFLRRYERRRKVHDRRRQVNRTVGELVVRPARPGTSRSALTFLWRTRPSAAN
jgi:Sec-independent protein translocase protein TatA